MRGLLTRDSKIGEKGIRELEMGAASSRSMTGYNPLETQGWMNYDECQWLYEMGQRYKTIVEVGSWAGKSTHALLTGNNKKFPKEGSVTAVDTWLGSPGELATTHSAILTQNIYQLFLDNVGCYLQHNLRVIRDYSVMAALRFPRASVEMVFIDADHSFEAVYADLVSWIPVTTKMICGHDVDTDGVRDALGKVFGVGGYRRTGVGSIWAKEIR